MLITIVKTTPTPPAPPKTSLYVVLVNGMRFQKLGAMSLHYARTNFFPFVVAAAVVSVRSRSVSSCILFT